MLCEGFPISYTIKFTQVKHLHKISVCINALIDAYRNTYKYVYFAEIPSTQEFQAKSKQAPGTRIKVKNDTQIIKAEQLYLLCKSQALCINMIHFVNWAGCYRNPAQC